MMTENKEAWSVDQLRKYDIKSEPIPRLEPDDARIDEYLKENKPFIIAGSRLVASAEHWTLDYLEQNVGDGEFAVYLSRDHKFKYHDDKKADKEFSAPTRRVDMKFGEFARRLREWKRGDDRLYLQQPLNATVGARVVQDFVRFDWAMARAVQCRHAWGALTSNLLLVSQAGNVTPCHYDEQQNLFAQVRGHKRFLLFPPAQFASLYPYVVGHPHDRQSQVDFERPDKTRFPLFEQARALDGVVGPGDVLHIPVYWWHHVESLMRAGPTVSITFWYKAGAPTVEYPLRDHQKVAIMRNVEKMLLEALKDPAEVGPLLAAMVLGRYVDC